MKQVLESAKIKLIEGQFCVNPDYVQERTGDYKLRDKIAAKWANSTLPLYGNGNVNHQCYFDIAKQTFMFTDKHYYNEDGYLSIYRIISPIR